MTVRKESTLAASLSVAIFVAVMGCRSTPPRKGKPIPPARARASACRVEVKGTVDAQTAPRLRWPMPEPRPFVDPVPTRPISLKKQRRAATRYRGQIRWREMSQLAARLWATAKSNTSKADALARTSPGSKEAVLLKRKAHAHLREAVALLGQVLHERKDFYLARLRLSYYLRHLHPIKALEV